MSDQAVRSLFVTLRRGFAGAPWFHRRILDALGLKHRHQCVEKPNNSSIRGMLQKVPHLVIIETDRMRYLRAMKDHYEQLPREPWVLHHDPPHPHLPHAGLAATPALLESAASGAAATPSPPAAALAAGEPPLLPPPPPPPPPPPLTPFAARQLKEHVAPVGLGSYARAAGKPLPPRKYFVERARKWRVRILTEHGLYSALALREHAQALQPKSYRRRVGIRD